MFRRLDIGWVGLAGALCLLTGCGRGPGDGGGGGAAAVGLGPLPDRPPVQGRPQVAYVTNGIASFWVIAELGARAAGATFDADVIVKMPAEGTPDQKRILEDLLVRNVDGIAVSPIDPDNQTEILNEACRRTYTITQDSDAPGSDRVCYVGMDNYEAGRLCGELVKEALPEGGSLMIFVGRLEQDNARRRRQGVIDELLGRAPDPTRYDEPGGVISGGGYTILGTLTDQFDRDKGKANAEDTLARHPDLDAMVGLFAYNPPLCLEALDRAGRSGDVKVVGFDEAEATLQGILSGTVYGTVVQDPYRYGWESIRILAGLARGDRSVLPEKGFLNIPARQIRKADCAAFRDELQRRLDEGRRIRDR